LISFNVTLVSSSILFSIGSFLELNFKSNMPCLFRSYLHVIRFRIFFAICRHSIASANFSSIFIRISSRKHNTPDVVCFSKSLKSKRNSFY
jgi:hypothetical protein